MQSPARIRHCGCNNKFIVTTASTKMRIITAICLSLLAIGAAGCGALKQGGDEGPTAPSGPPSSGSNIIYSAVGASDVIGFGSTLPCIPFDDCNGNGYVWVAG